MDEGPPEKTMDMDLSVDGENLELTQQVQQCHIVISSLRETFAQMIKLKREDPDLSPNTVAQLANLKTRYHIELRESIMNRKFSTAFLGHTCYFWS